MTELGGDGRYARQLIFPGIGPSGQQKLAESTVVVLGCGALGSVCASALCRAGVGHLRVVDRDFIEGHNLHRQILYDEEDVRAERPKALAAAEHLSRINSGVEVEGIVADISHRNIERLVRGAQVIVDGLDNLDGRYLINDVAQKLRIPWIYGAAVGSYGMTMTFVPGKTPCFRCVFPDPPTADLAVTCETAGVINAAPIAIGALESAEATKLLVSASEPDAGLRYLDVWTGALMRVETVEAAPECPACRGQYDYLEARAGSRATTLCGQNAVQIAPAADGGVAIRDIAARLRRVGRVRESEVMLRVELEGYVLTLFADGRAIVKGTPDESVARALYAKYVGL